MKIVVLDESMRYSICNLRKATMSSENNTNEANASKIFAIIGGVICIIGGISLAGLKAQGTNSMLESIANGMGFYFVGKGTYMIAMVFQLRSAIANLMKKD
jgi:ethanolamine utilization microcompartment shell protein EutL